MLIVTHYLGIPGDKYGAIKNGFPLYHTKHFQRISAGDEIDVFMQTFQVAISDIRIVNSIVDGLSSLGRSPCIKKN